MCRKLGGNYTLISITPILHYVPIRNFIFPPVIHTDTARVQHVNVGLAQARPNYKMTINYGSKKCCTCKLHVLRVGVLT